VVTSEEFLRLPVGVTGPAGVPEKGEKSTFLRVTERTEENTAGAVSYENFTAVLQCFLQESKFFLEK
jgi:hypothetical protein